MAELNITIHIPELGELAAALRLRSGGEQTAAQMTEPSAPPAPAPVGQAQPAPTAEPPKYTQSAISLAGAALIREDPAAMPKVQALLKKYGVETTSALTAEQLTPFGDELAALGAKL